MATESKFNGSTEAAKCHILSSETGRGLYATSRMRQGETILRLPLVTQGQPDKYSIEAWPGIHLNCSEGSGGAVNHSCSPNAAVRDGKLFAWACIEPGEEITIDYKKTENKLAVPFECECGSKNCRGMIE